jgi:hypothetical protein
MEDLSAPSFVLTNEFKREQSVYCKEESTGLVEWLKW